MTSFRLTLVIMALVLVSTVANAQQVSGFVESYHGIDASGDTPQLDVYVHSPLKGNLSLVLWTLTSKPWSEGYAGLSYAPKKWVEVSGSIGLETAENPVRVAGSIWLGTGRFSLLAIGEEGGSGHWYKGLGAVQVTKTVSLGVMSQTFVGSGPYAEKKLGKITVWGMYAVENRGILGVKFNF